VRERELAIRLSSLNNLDSREQKLAQCGRLCEQEWVPKGSQIRADGWQSESEVPGERFVDS
jgi:hypothetical protein